jgi:zinc D-Ala-D-Ala carboxypeptidase
VDADCTTAVYYVNTNNGETVFENKKSITSEENKFVSFSSKLKHSGTTNTCSNKCRIVINLIIINMKLSANFQLSELVKSQVAERKGIPNNPSPAHIDNLKALCVNVLQPIRSHFDSPVLISSGYRSAELCIAIGSKPTSQHSEGKAADIEVVNVDNKVLAEWIRDNLEFDQLILEFYRDGEPDSGWIHVSWNSDNNRSQTLKAIKDENGKTVYKPWQ